MNLNVPPNTDGLIDERDVERLKEYGMLISESFSSPIDYTISVDDTYESQPEYTLKLGKLVKDIRYVILREDIEHGQRVESFKIYAKNNGASYPLYQGRCIGNKKICCLVDPFADQNPLLRSWYDTNELVIKITSSREKVNMKAIAVY